MDNCIPSSPLNFQHPKGLCYVSEKYKLIFLPVPKNASTSVRNIGELEFCRSNIMSYSTALKEGKYRAFAIIRDPLERFISGFTEVCVRAAGDSPHILSTDFYWWKGKERFVRFLDELEKEWFDAHLFPQHFYLTDYEGQPFLIDAYIDIRELDTELPRLLTTYGVSLPEVPRLNVHDDREKQGILGKFRRRVRFSYSRRSLYYFMSYIVRILQRTSPPTAEEVRHYIQSDEPLRARIEAFLEPDRMFIVEARRRMSREAFSVLRGEG